jgi:predicted transcriptional regulator
MWWSKSIAVINAREVEREMKRAIALVMVFQLVALSTAFALINEGMPAPEFTVTSGDGAEITLRELIGTVTTIFYETKAKEIIEKNRALKNELNLLYKGQTDSIKKSISRIVIVDCRKASWPFIGIWKSKLVENSKKEGIMIYGDWDGKFAKNYNIMDEETNFLIIDKKGAIRYSKAGQIEKNEIDKIKTLLTKLSEE